MAKTKKSVKKGAKKIVKPARPGKVAKKPVKKAVKKPAKKLVKPARPGKPAKKAVKKAVKKSVKPVRPGKPVAKKAFARKPIAAAAPKVPERSLMGGNELPEGETRRVLAVVKDAILRNTEEHPFFESTDNKSVVIVSKEVEFVDTNKGVYVIPRGTTISVIKGDMGATWGIERHTD